MSETEFWTNSALGQSLERIQFNKEHLIIQFSNTQGLPLVYNTALASPKCKELVAFIHDDVWIDDIFFAERIAEGLGKFDVFGVIGNRKCAALQPSWAFTDRSLSWDHLENLIGAIAHGDYPFGTVQKYQETQGSCALIDGVMMAANRSKLDAHQIRFDERFKFHFYDVDFCRSLERAGLNLGVYPVSLTHQSSGQAGGEAWASEYIEYARKWRPDNTQVKISPHTPAHDHSNPDILALMSGNHDCIIEVGCSRGALARDYLAKFSCNQYIGVEIDEDAAEIARQHCTHVITTDIETMTDSEWDSLFPSNLWIFGDCLEHLRNPWTLLRRIRTKLDFDAWIIACLPNAQHWSVQTRLATGNFFYENEGLLDRTHLRWFTRKTSIDLFESTGYAVESVSLRIFDEPQRELFLPAIMQLAERSGSDPNRAAQDCTPLQHIIVARPI